MLRLLEQALQHPDGIKTVASLVRLAAAKGFMGDTIEAGKQALVRHDMNERAKSYLK